MSEKSNGHARLRGVSRGRKRRTGYSFILGRRFEDSWNWHERFDVRNFDPSKHKFSLFAILIVGLSLAGNAWASDPQNGLFHHMDYAPVSCVKTLAIGAPCNDPTTLIWQGTGPNIDLSEFNTFGFATVYGSSGNCIGGISFTGACVSIQSNNANSAQILTKNSIGDLSVTNGKTLAFHFSWNIESGGINANNEWGWFLTTNSTLSHSTNYNPRNDASVVLNDKIVCNANCNTGTATFVSQLYFLRTIGKGDTIESEGTDVYPASCTQGSNPTFLCQTTQLGTVPYQSTGGVADSVLYANVTAKTNPNGCSVSAGPVVNGAGCSWLLNANQIVGTTGWASSDTFPYIQIQSAQYYLGFYTAQSTGANNDDINWMFNEGSGSGGQTGNMDCFYYVAAPTSTTLGPQIDTGGFFGPIIKALISVGVFIASNIINFLVFLGALLGPVLSATFNVLQPFFAAVVSAVANAIVAMLNAIGNFFGWGNIGTEFSNFVTGVIQFFTTGLASALNWLLRIILRSLDVINILVTWVGFYLPMLADVLADLVNLIAEIVTFATAAFDFYGTSFAFVLILTFLWYVADEGLDGLFNWFETTKWAIFLSYDILERMINFGISSITWLIGRIPTFDGTTLPNIPTINISGGPHFPSMAMRELKEGNIFSLVLFSIGTIFLVFFETSTLPGSIAAFVPNASPQVTASAPFVSGFAMIFIRLIIYLLPILVIGTIGQKVYGIGGPQIPVKVSDIGRKGTASKVSGSFAKREGRFGHGAKLVIRGEEVGRSRKELQMLRALTGKRRKEKEEEVRERELKEVHGRDLKGPDLT